jgi:hypothetical protein
MGLCAVSWIEMVPVCVDQFDKAAVCGSGDQVFESTSHIS